MTLSTPYPLGVTLRGDGANVAIYSETADSVTVCLFPEGGEEQQTRLERRTGHVFHGLVEGLVPGMRYGVRVDGPWDPANGLRHNPAKVLLDPHATAITGRYDLGQAQFSHRLDAQSRWTTPTRRVTSPSASSPTRRPSTGMPTAPTSRRGSRSP